MKSAPSVLILFSAASAIGNVWYSTYGSIKHTDIDQLGLTNSSSLCSGRELFVMQQIVCFVMAGRVALYVVKNCELQLMGKGRGGRGQLKCDGTRAETRFRLSAKRTNPFKSVRASVHSTTGSRGVRISGSNAGYTMFRGSVKGTGYPLHSLVSPSLPLPCVSVCHQISIGVYWICPGSSGIGQISCPLNC